MTAPTRIVQLYGKAGSTEAAAVQEATTLGTTQLQALVEDDAFTSTIVADKFAAGAIPAAALADGSVAPVKVAAVASSIGVPFVIHSGFLAAAASIDIFDGNAPFAFRIVDVICQCKGTNAGGTVKLNKGTVAAPGTDITDAITCDTVKDVTRAGTIDGAVSDIAAGGSLSVVKNNANDKPLLTIVCVRL